MDLSAAATMIKQFERFRSAPYLDAVGKATIGYGSRWLKGEPVSLNTPPISEPEALSQLIEDIKPLALKLSELTPKSLSERQINALVVLVYNIGLGAFEHSSILQAINEGKANDTIKSDWEQWNKGTVVLFGTPTREVLPGLVKRRAAEVALFFSDQSQVAESASREAGLG